MILTGETQLKNKITFNLTERFGPYRVVNTLRLSHENQSVDV